jgi:hypothetical protein
MSLSSSSSPSASSSKTRSETSTATPTSIKELHDHDDEVTSRLKNFESIRHGRASATQLLSGAGIETQREKLQDDVLRYLQGENMPRKCVFAGVAASQHRGDDRHSREKSELADETQVHYPNFKCI